MATSAIRFDFVSPSWQLPFNTSADEFDVFFSDDELFVVFPFLEDELFDFSSLEESLL